MINFYLDIETIPCQSPEYKAKVRDGIKPPGNIKKPESIAQWMEENADAAVDEAVAKTSFDPAHGHICCIGFAVGDKAPEYYEARTLADVRHVIEGLYSNLPEMGLVRFVGHNVSGFDLRFILCRSIVLGIPIPQIFPRDIKPWSQEVFDTMVAWAGARGTIGQDRLCDALGLPGKGDFDGSMVAEAWANGEYAKISRYCLQDVETVRAIHRRFEAVGF